MAKINDSLYMNGDFDYLHDSNLTAEISARMQVPQRIQMNKSDSDDEHETEFSGLQSYNKVDMHVPERILVVGQDQHIGIAAPSLEVKFENSIMPHTVLSSRGYKMDEHSPAKTNVYTEDYKKLSYDEDMYDNDDIIMNRTRLPDNSTTAVELSDANKVDVLDEMVHLRKQLAKLNRRIMNLERDVDSYQQRDKILLSVVSVYFVFKILLWMNRT